MNNVYIIGNGFDLNLGLNTSYKDFISSDFFRNNLGGGCELFDYLHQVDKESNWIDIEKELKIYSNKTTVNNNYLDDYKKLCVELTSYIRSIELASMDKDSEAFKLFSDRDTSGSFKVINFNYTDSVAYILENIGYEDIRKDTIINIHGSASTSQIIFGVDDSAKIKSEHSFIRKSTSTIYNGGACIKLLDGFDRLHIFGHSLGESDHMYFRFLRSLASGNDKPKEINIYHYGEDARFSMYEQLHELTLERVAGLKNNTSFNEFDVKK